MSTRETLRSTLMDLLAQEMGESFPTLTEDQDLRESLRSWPGSSALATCST